MSKPGTPIDNAPPESFFSILKSECINFESFDTFSQAISCIDDFIYFYNFQRIQLYSGLTPFQLRFVS